MDDETKSRLERLQAEIRLQTGERVTEQEILAQLLKDAVDSKATLIDSFRPNRVPLSEEERTRFHEGTIASGEATDEEDVDDILYG